LSFFARKLRGVKFWRVRRLGTHAYGDREYAKSTEGSGDDDSGA
jgi:hypothetical protein